jgi:hypothetical protein
MFKLDNLAQRKQSNPDKANVDDVFSTGAPQASSAKQCLNRLYPRRFSLNVDHVKMSDPLNHSSLSSVHDDSSEYRPSPRANHQKTTRKSSSNADVDALVGHLSPLKISSSGKNKGTQLSSPARASHDPRALSYTLYDGIPHDMTHASFHKRAVRFNCVVALDHLNPHTLPPNVFFFQVSGSTMPDKKSQWDKFVLGIQVLNPEAVETTSARLTADGLGRYQDCCPGQVCPRTTSWHLRAD